MNWTADKVFALLTAGSFLAAFGATIVASLIAARRANRNRNPFDKQ